LRISCWIVGIPVLPVLQPVSCLVTLARRLSRDPTWQRIAPVKTQNRMRCPVPETPRWNSRGSGRESPGS
jgi:hypothetical protein